MTDLITPYATARKATILVVEDNPDQWFMIRRAIGQGFPEVEPVWVPNADQAMQHLDNCAVAMRNLPKIILMDLYMPDREQGWNLLKTIKTHHIYREIPVVMLSQSNDPLDVCESYSLRINSYILKPATYEEWLNCMTAFRHYWWEAVTLPKHI